MELTAENLVRAIQEAESLSELKKLVGPPWREEQDACYRVKTIDHIYERYGNNRGDWPAYIRERMDALEAKQNAFEAEYC